MFNHILASIAGAAVIGIASLVAMVFIIDGAPMMAAALIATPFGY